MGSFQITGLQIVSLKCEHLPYCSYCASITTRCLNVQKSLLISLIGLHFVPLLFSAQFLLCEDPVDRKNFEGSNAILLDCFLGVQTTQDM